MQEELRTASDWPESGRYRIRSKKIALLRKDRCLRQEQMAKFCQIGLKQYWRYEHSNQLLDFDVGVHVNTLENLSIIAAQLGVPRIDLIEPMEPTLVAVSLLPTVAVVPSVPTPGRAPDTARTSNSTVGTAYYVKRPKLEDIALNALRKPHHPVAIHAADDLGKRTFITYLLNVLEQKYQHAEASVVVRPPPLSRLLQPMENFRSFSKILASLTRAVLAELSESLCPFNQTPGAGKKSAVSKAAPRSLAEVLECALLRTGGLLFLILENADALEDMNLLCDLWLYLRTLVEERCGVWSRLRMVVSVSRDPSLLEPREQSSFFAQCKKLALPEFLLEQTSELAHGHAVHTSTKALERMHEQIGGHPLLWNLALEHAQDDGLPFEQIILEDPLVLYSDHLGRIQNRIVYRKLVNVLRQVYQSGLRRAPWIPGSPKDAAQFSYLLKTGLLVVDPQTRTVRPRNVVYRRFLSSWLGE